MGGEFFDGSETFELNQPQILTLTQVASREMIFLPMCRIIPISKHPRALIAHEAQRSQHYIKPSVNLSFYLAAFRALFVGGEAVAADGFRAALAGVAGDLATDAAEDGEGAGSDDALFGEFW